MNLESPETDKLLKKYSLALTHLTNFACSFEGRFDTSPSDISYEELEEYVEAALFLKSISRNVDRIDAVQDEMENRLI